MRNSFIFVNFLLLLAILVTGGALAVGAWLRSSEGLQGILYRGPESPTPVVANPRQRPQLFALKIKIGAYDPDEQFSKAEGLAIDHFYLNWTQYQRAILESRLAYSRTRGRTAFITVEPYATAGNSALVLQDVTAGVYDGLIQSICTDIGQSGVSTMVAWGPAPDSTDSSVPWIGASPESYKAAYRYFVQHCRQVAPNILAVWSPIGNARLSAYWPGADVVAYIGLPVLLDPLRDRTRQGELIPFEDLFAPKYRLVEGFGAPVFVSELGVSGTTSEQAFWLDAAKMSAAKFPLLGGMVYFNAIGRRELGDVGSASDEPVDWRISYWTLLPPPNEETR